MSMQYVWMVPFAVFRVNSPPCTEPPCSTEISSLSMACCRTALTPAPEASAADAEPMASTLPPSTRLDVSMTVAMRGRTHPCLWNIRDPSGSGHAEGGPPCIDTPPEAPLHLCEPEA